MQKFIFKSIGLFFVGLAFLGAFLPILPTTPFLLVAAGCFAKSSPRLHTWLINNKWFGPLIYHWQTSRSIPKKAKVIALLSIVLAVSWSLWVLNSWFWQLVLVGIMIWPIMFIARLPLAKQE